MFEDHIYMCVFIYGQVDKGVWLKTVSERNPLGFTVSILTTVKDQGNLQ